MGRLFVLVVILGTLIGLAWPSGEADAPAPEPDRIAAASEAHDEDADDWSSTGDARETRLTRGGSGHFYVNAEVNGQIVDMVIDTGASFVALTLDDARRVGMPVDPSQFEVIGSGASGDVRGQVFELDRVSIDGKEVRGVRAAVAEGLTHSLLGQSYLSQIQSVQMSGDTMVLR